MMRGLRRYLNAALIGFIVTFVVYLYWKLDRGEITTGIAVALAGAVIFLVVYIYLDQKFGSEPELYDKDGNLVDKSGKILRSKSQL
jgi:hypothetical protein